MHRVILLAALLAPGSFAHAEEPVAPVVEVTPGPVDPAPAQTPPPVVKEKIVSEKELLDDDGYVVRLSLPTEEDAAVWRQKGIRIGLGYAHGRRWGRTPAPFTIDNGGLIRALARVDEWWSVGFDFEYASSNAGRMTGLRYATTAQVIGHPWQGLGLGLGIGLGGNSLTPVKRAASRPGSGGEVSNVTFPASETLSECTGPAWIGLARAEYQFVVGQMFSSGPFLEATSQYTRCGQSLGRADRETGLPIEGRQWWLQAGYQAGWWLTWR